MCVGVLATVRVIEFPHTFSVKLQNLRFSSSYLCVICYVLS